MAGDPGAAAGRDGGVCCFPKSCQEPQDSHTGTAGSHHTEARPRPHVWGCIRSQGWQQPCPGAGQGPVRCVQGSLPEKVEILLQNQIAASVLGCSSETYPRQGTTRPCSPGGGDEQELGHLFTRARTPLPHHAADGHLEGTRSHRATSFSLTHFVSRCCIQASGAVRLQARAAPGFPGEPAKQTPNVTAVTRRLPQPQHRRHQSCSTSSATRRRRAGKSGRIPPLVHALVSAEPQIPRALLNPASAELDGKGEGFCRAAISISGPCLSCFAWAQGVF